MHYFNCWIISVDEKIHARLQYEYCGIETFITTSINENFKNRPMKALEFFTSTHFSIKFDRDSYSSRGIDDTAAIVLSHAVSRYGCWVLRIEYIKLFEFLYQPVVPFLPPFVTW